MRRGLACAYGAHSVMARTLLRARPVIGIRLSSGAIVVLTACAQGVALEVPAGDDAGPVASLDHDAGGAQCPTGERECGGQCVDTTRDNSNCGGCGYVCNAYTSCVGSGCQQTSCMPGQANCGGDAGVECVDLTSDPNNCGACGNACELYATCSAGKCVLSCPADAGLSACSGDAGATCVDTATDNSNCGGCNIACNSPATCTAGQCDCPPGQTSCNNVCTDTSSDSANCGACGMACPPSQACASSQCRTPPAKSIVFVSSVAYAGGGLGGLAGADAKCQSLATAAGLTGTFGAWLSDSTTGAADRLPHWPTPFVLADGTTTVASGWSQLVSSSLSHAIDMTETKGAPTGGSNGSGVWTGTTAQGTSTGDDDCQDWTSTSAAVSVAFHPGEWTATDGSWTLDLQTLELGSICGNTAPIYCVQKF